MNMTARGRLVSFEGGEGAGKSTHARFAKEFLERAGRRVMLTREPGGTPLAESIRKVLLDSASNGMPPMTELLLMFAARTAHIEGLIRPALESGADVICDRFVDASYAYQGGGRGIPVERIEALQAWVLGTLQPDRVVVFDLPPTLGLERTGRRGDQNRFEGESLDFLERVRQTYLQRARRSPDRYRVLDASGSLQHVQAQLVRVLEEWL